MISPESLDMVFKSLVDTHTQTHTDAQPSIQGLVPVILFACFLQLQLNTLNKSEKAECAWQFSVAAQIQTPLLLILCFQSENPDWEDVNGFWPYSQ